MDKEKIVVSFTSWKGKMKYDISPSIISLCNQTLSPDKVYLNLSLTEFDNDKDSIPDNIKQLERELNGQFEINWVEGENTKCFKKFLPIIDNHQNDIIITADDDIIYPDFYVEGMVNSFRLDPTRPVTTTYHTFWGAMLMYGGASLYKPEFLKGWKDIITDDIIHTFEDDWFYSYVLLINGIRPRLANKEVMFSPYTYVPYIIENQMFNLNMYNTGKTCEVLNKRLEDLGYSYEELVKKIYKKYKNEA